MCFVLFQLCLVRLDSVVVRNKSFRCDLRIFEGYFERSGWICARSATGRCLTLSVCLCLCLSLCCG